MNEKVISEPLESHIPFKGYHVDIRNGIYLTH
jgi:hypothetical protein